MTTDPLAGIDVLTHIIERHADEAAFSWTLRDHAVTSPAYKLDDLCRVDRRVESHLGGLRVAGEAGRRACRDNLDIGEAGEMFTCAVLALERADVSGMGDVLDAGAADDGAARGIVSALAWLPYPRVAAPLRALCAARTRPDYVHIGIAAHAIHRRDPGDLLVD